jgi:predicted metal-dependent enzyme (double-stranded beta helix superfamily)
MSLYPHDHQMWAVIALTPGGRTILFFLRARNGLIVQRGETLRLKDTIPLGEAQ